VLEITPSENTVPILADAARITRVINTFLGKALSFSPTDQPVTVQLKVEETVALVSVHEEGLTIPSEEQECLWERFHDAKGIVGEQESDQGFALDFYLSRAFIERHHGSVGVQSDPGHGATFWFTLPMEASVGGER
jgi:signal transduction histidine kinase